MHNSDLKNTLIAACVIVGLLIGAVLMGMMITTTHETALKQRMYNNVQALSCLDKGYSSADCRLIIHGGR